MFTGIIEETGKILSVTTKDIEIEAKLILEGTKTGDSIAVNGVCLTVAEISKNGFRADVSEETYKVTMLSRLKAGNFVNLERAMPASGRFGGHVVTGHIDNLGNIQEIKKSGDFYEVVFKIPSELSKYVVKKGAIAIDGISLTVAEINDDYVKTAIIPHTFNNTVLKYLNIGDFVNIEVDILAKHVEKFLSTGDNKSRIDENFLFENGYL